ncbi:MAG: FAD-dependent monooxygenase [Pseudomonadota bacterium]|nr:FAD-dependent monooxygenase [Pseudomonadota bacterium]
MKSKREKVVIIGGSMAGLFAAISLKSLGFEVSLYERANSSLANRGAGIATHKELYDALDNAGVQLQQKMGIESIGRQLLGKNGDTSHREIMKQTMSSWGLIYRFLRSQIDDREYTSGATLTTLDSGQDKKVLIGFGNGKIVKADWVIGADGMHSKVRELLNPKARPTYAGYLAWRGLIEESLIKKTVLQSVANVITFGSAPGGHWLGYLVAGKHDNLTTGKRWYNWGWYRHASTESLKEHLIGQDKKYYKNGIPHNLIRQDLIDGMRAEAARYLAPQIQKIISATSRPFIQGMYDVGSDRLVFDRIILIGDAAFTARPHVGLGVSKAAEDAATLAKALADRSRDEALNSWEKDRLRYGLATLRWGRDLGSHILPAEFDIKKDTKGYYYSSPEVLITQNASNEPRKHLSSYL